MEFRINYNPYELKTNFFLDGEKLPEDSRFSRIKEKRLQQWLNKNGDWDGLCSELKELTNEGRVEIKFKGRAVDYEDLKLYLKQENAKKITLLEPDLTKNDLNIMSKLDKIVEKKVIKSKDIFTSQQIDDIRTSYKKAKDTSFKVCVIATMSSGKSTLINALLGSDLLPSKTAACTATITTITDNDHMDRFNVKCLDKVGNQVDERENVTLEELEKFNDNINIKQIDLIGPVPGIESKKMTLYLVDTPGPNNSTNDDHEKLTDEIINSDENTMVIYVMSPQTIQSDDNNELLQSIADVMQKEGKQAEDRFLFVINKCDELDPEDSDDTIENAIEIAKNYLIGKGIYYPNIYPVTAEIAKLIRMKERGEKITRSDKRVVKNWVENFDSDDQEDNEYQRLLSFEKFASLPPESRENIENQLKVARIEENISMEALIHSGVPALEETVEEYLEKYAYPMKINDSIKELIKIVDQEEMKSKFIKEIQEDKDMLRKVENDIKQSGEKLKKIEKNKKNILAKIKSFTFDIDETIIKYEVSKDLAVITEEYSGRKEIKKDASDRIFREFNKKQQGYLSKLERKLTEQIEIEIVNKGSEMLNEFRIFMDEFKSSIKIGNFNFDKVVSFNNCDIDNLDSLIEENTEEKNHKETIFVENPKKRGFFGKFKFWQPKEIEKTISVSDGEFVNVDKIVETAVMSWKSELYSQIDDAFERAQNQVEDFNKGFEKKMNQAEKIVNKNLNEIKENIENNLKMEKEEKEQAIKENHKKMEIINGIYRELNEILNF